MSQNINFVTYLGKNKDDILLKCIKNIILSCITLIFGFSSQCTTVAFINIKYVDGKQVLHPLMHDQRWYCWC